ncbi:glycosyltransferase family 4 protein [Candidatus Saccharibacteria bacterium]|nr:glycosyltransferase family 4 protein [Candidatus Saccharibacteria bacterium]
MNIAWFVPDVEAGSGGQRTIFQNINYVAKNGHKNDVYILNTEKSPEIIASQISESYFDLNAKIRTRLTDKKYDIAVATYHDTSKLVATLPAREKLYFVQDYEPWFFPMGENYLNAEKSYTYNLKCITIGRWLAKKLHDDFSIDTNYFDFCADLDIYHPLPDIKKEDAICCVFQPGKPRRCGYTMLRALQIVQSIRPETKVYLFGSPPRPIGGLKVEYLGIKSVTGLNELYNRCSVGFCLSATNPSRVPFEMMAAGLPVVEARLENTVYDLPEDGCLLAEPAPLPLASALLKVLSDKSLQEKLSSGGKTFMKDFPLETGFSQFGDLIDGCKKSFKKSTPITHRYKAPSPELIDFFEASLPELYIGDPSEMVSASLPRRAFNRLKGIVK